MTREEAYKGGQKLQTYIKDWNLDGQFESFKDSVDGGEAHHVKGFLLVKGHDSPYFVFDEVDKELDIYDVLLPSLVGMNPR